MMWCTIFSIREYYVNYFTAYKWFHFIDMHFRHHVR